MKEAYKCKLLSSLPACPKQWKSLNVMTTSCLPQHRSYMMISTLPTGSAKHIPVTSRVLLSVVQFDDAQDGQIFSQFYLHSSFHNTNFVKSSVLFSQCIYIKFCWNTLSCHVPHLPCVFLLGRTPEQFCFPDSSLGFLWMNTGMSRLTKDMQLDPL